MFYGIPWFSHPVKFTVWPTSHLFYHFCLHKSYMQLNSWGVAGKWDSCPDQQPEESTHTHKDRTIHQTHRSEPPFISLLEHRVWLGLWSPTSPGWREIYSLTFAERSQQKNNLLKAGKKVTLWPPASSTLSIFLLVIHLFYKTLLYINICKQKWKRSKDFWMQWAGQSTG